MLAMNWVFGLTGVSLGAIFTALALKARHQVAMSHQQQETIRLLQQFENLQGTLQTVQEKLDTANTALLTLQEEKSILLAEKSRLSGKSEELEKQLEGLKNEETTLKQTVQSLQQAIQELNGEKEGLKTAVEKDNEWKQNIEAQWKQQLESFLLANLKTVKQDAEGEYEAKQKAIEEKVKGLLEPLSKAVLEYKKNVEAVDKDHHAGTKLIEQELKRLTQINNKLSAALTYNKGRGDWGELELRRLLEDSGMQEGVSFQFQAALENKKRPDFRILMPGDRVLFVDSKALQFDPQWFVEEEMSSDALEFRQKKFVHSLRQAIKGLVERDYQGELKESAGFVVLYVPREAMLSNALMLEPVLFEEAYAKKVILAGPLNLMAILKAIEHSWVMAEQSKRALKVLDEAQRLYNKSILFVQRFDAIGKGLQSTVHAYQQTITAFEGQGGFIGKLQNLERLGFKHKDKLLQEVTHVDYEHQALKTVELLGADELEPLDLEDVLETEELPLLEEVSA